MGGMGMITSLRLVNFKNFADETLGVGPFTVIVGSNASGKSNIRDAFRLLHGIGRGYALAEILGGRYGEGGQREWAGVRGAAGEIIRFGQDAFLLEVRIDELSYSIKVSRDRAGPGTFRVAQERLALGDALIFRTRPIGARGSRSQAHRAHVVVGGAEPDSRARHAAPSVRDDRPALTQLRGHREVGRALKDDTDEVARTLADMRFLDPDPGRMREPAFPGAAALGDGGENLPTVLEEICSDPERQQTIASWVRELTSMDVAGFSFPRDPSGRVSLSIRETNGGEVSAHSASDSTLRFLAMLAALLGTSSSGLYVFEEIAKGIHPNRLWLLLELIERQTDREGVRVVTTTHSPDMLGLVSERTFESTSVVSRPEGSADAVIRPVGSLPNARELRSAQGLGRLHASGWMEDMLALTAWRDEDAAAGERTS